MKYTYKIQTEFNGKWVTIHDYCGREWAKGYLYARRNEAPRPAYQLVRSDGKVVEEVKGEEDVYIGMIAGWPTPEQYESAANRALEKAKAIREQQAQQEARRAR